MNFIMRNPIYPHRASKSVNMRFLRGAPEGCLLFDSEIQKRQRKQSNFWFFECTCLFIETLLVLNARARLLVMITSGTPIKKGKSKKMNLFSYWSKSNNI